MKRIVLLLGLIGLLGLVGCEDYTHYVPIVSLRSIAGIDGSFFLGCGSVGTEMYYVTYTVKNGEHYLLRIRTQETAVIETDDKEPCFRFVAHGNYNGNSYAANKWRYLLERKQISGKLYVPIGTIIREFKLE